LREIKLLEPEEIADAVVALIEDDEKSGEYVVIDNLRADRDAHETREP
jgi:hypothetical protein